MSSLNSMTFHDFFHDLFRFSKTLGLVVTSKVFTQTNKLWCPPKYVPLALFNYPSLSYIVLALSLAVTKLSKNILIFHDFPGLEIEFLNSMTFRVFYDLYEPCLKKIVVYLAIIFLGSIVLTSLWLFVYFIVLHHS